MNPDVLLAAAGSDDAPAGLGFIVLAAIVSFNTLIYVVLTLAKLIPWPRQARPSEVRRGVKRIGLTINEESVMSEIPLPPAPESDDPAENMRLATARHEIPQAFKVAGGLVMAFAVAVGLSPFSVGFLVHVLEFVTGVILLVTGVLLGYRSLTGRSMTWIWVVFATVLVLLLVLEGYRFDAFTPRAYA